MQYKHLAFDLQKLRRLLLVPLEHPTPVAGERDDPFGVVDVGIGNRHLARSPSPHPKKEPVNRMSHAKRGFTVVLKRPKRHLLNKPAVSKASWVDEIDLRSDRTRADADTWAVESPGHYARAAAEKLFAPRTVAGRRILPALSPVSYSGAGSNEASIPKPDEAMTAFVDIEENVVSIDTAEQEKKAGTIALANERVRVKRRHGRVFPKRDFPAGRRWIRLLPSVLQERALPTWKRMRNARASSPRHRRNNAGG